MSVGFVIDVRGLAAVQRAIRRMTFLDTDRLFDAIGTVVESQVRRRIQKQEGPPDGGSWAPYSEKYAAWKESIGKGSEGFLQLEGHLHDSITHNVLHDGVEIGSNLKYAATHQLGSEDGSTPARPYLGLSADNEHELEDDITRWLKREFGI